MTQRTTGRPTPKHAAAPTGNAAKAPRTLPMASGERVARAASRTIKKTAKASGASAARPPRTRTKPTLPATKSSSNATPRTTVVKSVVVNARETRARQDAKQPVAKPVRARAKPSAATTARKKATATELERATAKPGKKTPAAKHAGTRTPVAAKPAAITPVAVRRAATGSTPAPGEAIRPVDPAAQARAEQADAEAISSIRRGKWRTAGIYAAIFIATLAIVGVLFRYVNSTTTRNVPTASATRSTSEPHPQQTEKTPSGSCSKLEACSGEWVACNTSESAQLRNQLQYGRRFTEKDLRDACKVDASRAAKPARRQGTATPNLSRAGSGAKPGPFDDSYLDALDQAGALNRSGSGNASSDPNAVVSRRGSGAGTAGTTIDLSRLGGSGGANAPGLDLRGKRPSAPLPLAAAECTDISQGSVQAFIASLRPSIKTEYERALKRNPDIHGKIMLLIEISSKGELSAKIDEPQTNLRDSEARAAILGVFNGKKMPVEPNSCPVTVNYPFIFSAT